MKQAYLITYPNGCVWVSRAGPPDMFFDKDTWVRYPSMLAAASDNHEFDFHIMSLTKWDKLYFDRERYKSK
jgi:hypothetical protein